MFTKVNAVKLTLLSICLIFFISACNTGKKTAYTKPKSTPSKITPKSSPKVLSEKNLRQEIIRYGKTCEGVRYKYSGKDRGGFDCSGFTSYVLKEYEIEASPSSRSQALQGKKIAVSKVQPGDLIFFGNAGKISHVAMVVSNTNEGITVIHSTTSRGVMVQNITKSSYWKPKILFARDIVGK